MVARACSLGKLRAVVSARRLARIWSDGTIHCRRSEESAAPRPSQRRGRQLLVVIAEFSDFECGHCAQVYRAFKNVLPRYRDDVRLEFFHYPLDDACNPAMTRPLHRNACLAAAASECAAAQGKFWPYHDLLFDNQKQLDRAQPVALSPNALDSSAVRSSKCIDSDETKRADRRGCRARHPTRSDVDADVGRSTIASCAASLKGDNLEHVIRTRARTFAQRKLIPRFGSGKLRRAKKKFRDAKRRRLSDLQAQCVFKPLCCA